jgi:hypothetical protein
MRTLASLLIVLCAVPASAGSISFYGPDPNRPPIYASLTDPMSPDWVAFTLSGDLHLAGDDVVVLSNSKQWDYDNLLMTQPSPGQSYNFWLQRSAMNWVNLYNQTRDKAGDLAHAYQWHFGPPFSTAPNDYMNADSIHMIGGAIVDLGGGRQGQEWTYIVNNGGAETVQVGNVAAMPEPASWPLALIGLLSVRWRRA